MCKAPLPLSNIKANTKKPICQVWIMRRRSAYRQLHIGEISTPLYSTSFLKRSGFPLWPKAAITGTMIFAIMGPPYAICLTSACPVPNLWHGTGFKKRTVCRKGESCLAVTLFLPDIGLAAFVRLPLSSGEDGLQLGRGHILGGQIAAPLSNCISAKETLWPNMRFLSALPLPPGLCRWTFRVVQMKSVTPALLSLLPLAGCGGIKIWPGGTEP